MDSGLQFIHPLRSSVVNDFSPRIYSSSSPKLSECLQKKKDITEQMEVKLDMGIDRQVEILYFTFCFHILQVKLLDVKKNHRDYV